MSSEVIIALASSALTAIVGPIIVHLTTTRFAAKPSHIFQQELKLSNIIQDKLLEIQETYNTDRVWITQFHNGGYFYPTGKSIQKFSMIYEITQPTVSSIQNNFQNIPINLFSKSINHISDEDILRISDFNNESLPTYGLKYLAQETGCKSSYAFALRTINGKFLGILGIDYTKHKKNLSDNNIEDIQYIVAALGGLLGNKA